MRVNGGEALEGLFRCTTQDLGAMTLRHCQASPGLTRADLKLEASGNEAQAISHLTELRLLLKHAQGEPCLDAIAVAASALPGRPSSFGLLSCLQTVSPTKL
jgi:hypothetical protein